jgi:hypothetical protein
MLRNIANNDVFQWIGKPCRRDELSLFSITTLEPFDKWDIDFVGPISPLTHVGQVCATLLPPQSI